MPNDNGSIRSYILSKQMINSGFEVDLISLTRGRKNLPIEVDGIKLSWIHLNYNNKMLFIKRLYIHFYYSFILCFKVLLKKYDLIYATSTPLSVGIPALLAKLIRNKPFIFEVRDVWPEVPIQMGIIKNNILKSLLKRVTQKIYNNASLVIPLSIGMKKCIQKNYKIENKKIHVIENGSSNHFFQINNLKKKKIRSKYFIDKKNYNIIYPGTFGLVNDVKFIINLAKKLTRTNIKFFLVGDGIEKNKIIQLSKENKTLNNNVFFIDPQPRYRVCEIISCCDALISTINNIKILEDNSANKFFDGLRAGKMIIINYQGWQKNFIESNKCGVFIDTNVKNSINKLVNIFDKDLHIEMGENSLKYSGKFENEYLSKKLINIIKNEKF